MFYNFFWASNFAAHATQCNARRILNFEQGVWGKKGYLIFRSHPPLISGKTAAGSIVSNKGSLFSGK